MDANRWRMRIAAKACLVACVLVVGLMIEESYREEERQEAAGRVVVQGTWEGGFAGIPNRGPFIIRDKDEWYDFWDRMTGQYSPKPEVPHIDFGRHMAVAWLGGRMNGLPRRVDPFAMKRRPDGVLEVTVSVGDRTGVVDPVQRFNNPFRIVAVKAAASVVFKEGD